MERLMMNQNTIRVFTLIELLVVVLIISLLAGMLLPALNKAQAAAKKVGCLSNQKQIGLLFDAYRGDHGFWPAARFPDYWHATLWTYIYDGTLYQNRDRLKGTIFYCPAKENPPWAWPITGYGMNAYLPPSIRTDDFLTQADKTPPRPGRIQIPSCTILVVDTHESWHANMGHDWTINNIVTFAHLDQAGVLYCDLHAVAANKTRMLETYARTPFSTEWHY